MSKAQPIAAIRGMHDILPPASQLWEMLEAKLRGLFSRYGFTEVRTPIVEPTELFARSIGEATDIVEKEMYTFLDRKGKSLTLRPEGTASVVRAVIEAGLLGKDGSDGPVHRFFYVGPMFRYERPQKGRQRQFYQIGAEVFGDAGPFLDAELLQLAWQLLVDLGLSGSVKLEVNTLGTVESRQKYRVVLHKFLESRANELCEDCRRRLEKNPLRVLDCKVPTCRQVLDTAPALEGHLDELSKKHFADVLDCLKRLDVPFTVNKRLVRGLDYYTGTTFEIVTGELGAQGAVLAGGRYDTLVSELGGPETPAIGFAAGLERLALLMERLAVPAEARASIAVIGLGEEAQRVALLLLTEFRRAGIQAIADLRGRSIKSQLRQADRLGAAYVVIIGEQELAEKVVMVKDMKAGSQEKIPLAAVELAAELKRRLRF